MFVGLEFAEPDLIRGFLYNFLCTGFLWKYVRSRELEAFTSSAFCNVFTGTKRKFNILNEVIDSTPRSSDENSYCVPTNQAYKKKGSPSPNIKIHFCSLNASPMPIHICTSQSRPFNAPFPLFKAESR